MKDNELLRKLKDPDKICLFSTGTDEHGMKVQQAAQKAGLVIYLRM